MLKFIEKQEKRPRLYTFGSSNMWMDPYISEQLLAMHLNPDIEGIP